MTIGEIYVERQKTVYEITELVDKLIDLYETEQKDFGLDTDIRTDIALKQIADSLTALINVDLETFEELTS